MTILIINNKGELKTYKNITDIKYDERIDRIELTMETTHDDTDEIELIDVKFVRKLEVII